jgi:four helix bundle protein
MQDFRGIKVWEKAHLLTIAIYRTTKPFPADERYGLTSQLRRAAMSIPANIAEGSSRRSDKEFANFLNFAMGSASEVEYLLLLSKDIGHLKPTVHAALQADIEEVKRMLTAFQKKAEG